MKIFQKRIKKRFYRLLPLTNLRRVSILRFNISIAFLFGFLFSIRLWLSTRSYPLSPIFDWLPAIARPFDIIILISLIILLILIILSKFLHVSTTLFILLCFLLAMLDQTRWQQWFYQYLLMLSAFWVCLWKGFDLKNQKVWLNACRFILIATYFWSGVQKLDIRFVERIFPFLTAPYLKYLFGDTFEMPRALVILVPILELSLGIGLLVKRLRNLSILLIVIMHALILLLLIPRGINSVVWQWNTAMIIFVIVLFWRAKDFSIRDLLLPTNVGLQLVVIILFGIMPFLSFFNLWDSSLSANLYSGNYTNAVITVSSSLKNRFPAEIQNHVHQNTSNGKFQINLNNWALRELNVPFFRSKEFLSKSQSNYAKTRMLRQN